MEGQRGDLLIGDEVIAEGVDFNWTENPPEPGGLRTWGGAMQLPRKTGAMPQDGQPLTMRLIDGREARIIIHLFNPAYATAEFKGAGPPPPALKR